MPNETQPPPLKLLLCGKNTQTRALDAVTSCAKNLSLTVCAFCSSHIWIHSQAMTWAEFPAPCIFLISRIEAENCLNNASSFRKCSNHKCCFRLSSSSDSICNTPHENLGDARLGVRSPGLFSAAFSSNGKAFKSVVSNPWTIRPTSMETVSVVNSSQEVHSHRIETSESLMALFSCESWTSNEALSSWNDSGIDRSSFVTSEVQPHPRLDSDCGLDLSRSGADKDREWLRNSGDIALALIATSKGASRLPMLPKSIKS